MLEVVNAFAAHVDHPIAYMHTPVLRERSDQDDFKPLAALTLAPATELDLGVIHAADSVEGSRRRIAAASRHVAAFGIPIECGIARARKPELIHRLLRLHTELARAVTQSRLPQARLRGLVAQVSGRPHLFAIRAGLGTPAMTAQGFALFDTAIGRCAIAWSERGIVGVLLPERDDAKLRARLSQRYPGALEAAPSPEAARTIEDIIALVAGEPRDLSDVPLDLNGVPEFNRRVYAVARTIKPGATVTYGAIAAQLGEPDARGVGEAMGQNPCPIIVPCHRVVAAGSKTGGFSAPGGAATKRRLLAIESARTEVEPTLFDRYGGLGFAVKRGTRTNRRGG
jgi:methylated-DNA-[protein]-cysteine S-methyltransferase